MQAVIEGSMMIITDTRKGVDGVIVSDQITMEVAKAEDMAFAIQTAIQDQHVGEHGAYDHMKKKEGQHEN